MATEQELMQQYMMNEMAQQQEAPQQQILQPQLPSEILELELNYEKSLEALEKKLKGMVLENKGKLRVWTQKHEPWMNDKGVSRILAIIKGHVDVNTFLTFLQDTEINQIAYDVSDEVATILANQSIDFDISPTYLGIIHSIITNNIFFAMKRAQGALTLRKIHDSTSRVENPQQMQQLKAQQQKGFLRRLF